MNWFFLALIGPLLYASTNHIDKVLLEKYFKVGGVGALMLFSSLLSVLALPIFYLADPTVLSVGNKHIFVLALVGFFNIPPKGNPELRSLSAVLNALVLLLAVQPAHPHVVAE